MQQTVCTIGGTAPRTPGTAIKHACFLMPHWRQGVRVPTSVAPAAGGPSEKSAIGGPQGRRVRILGAPQPSRRRLLPHASSVCFNSPVQLVGGQIRVRFPRFKPCLFSPPQRAGTVSERSPLPPPFHHSERPSPAREQQPLSLQPSRLLAGLRAALKTRVFPKEGVY